jgi:hypothetical protein
MSISTLEIISVFFEKNFVKVLTPLKGVLKRVPAYRSSQVLVEELELYGKKTGKGLCLY